MSNTARVSVDTNYRTFWIRPSKVLWPILPVTALHELEVFARNVGEYWVGWPASYSPARRRMSPETYWPQWCWEPANVKQVSVDTNSLRKEE